MRLTTPLLAASLLLVACGAGPETLAPPSPLKADAPTTHRAGEALDFRLGTRLLAHHLRAPGTEPLLLAIVDRQTGQPCRFAPAADGKRRCLPIVQDLIPSRELFLDDRCELPLFVPAEGAMAPPADQPYVAIARPGCERRHDVRRLEAPTGNAPLYTRDGTTCRRASNPVPAGARAPGALIPPDLWVEGQGALTTGTVGIVAEEITSADGGRFRVSLVDAALGVPCVHVGSGVCLAERAWASFTFADARCSVPLAAWSNPEDGCKPPPFGDRVAGNARWRGLRIE